jgi:hypothetical protein
MHECIQTVKRQSLEIKLWKTVRFKLQLHRG